MSLRAPLRVAARIAWLPLLVLPLVAASANAVGPVPLPEGEFAPAGPFTQAGSAQFGAIFLTMLGAGGVLAAAYVSIRSTAKNRDGRPRKAPRPAAVQDAPTAAPRAVAPAVVARKRLPLVVDVQYPDIPGEYPDVWGAGEEITILVAARDPDGHGAAAGARVELAIGSENVVAERIPLTTNAEGLASVPRRFPRPADLVLTARLVVDDRPVGEGRRELRIVDYRQEIIETFNDFKGFAAKRFPVLDAKTTPREFCERFADQSPATPRRPLERLAYVLELANYSDHPIDRSHFAEMVEAFLELERAGVLGEGE